MTRVTRSMLAWLCVLAAGSSAAARDDTPRRAAVRTSAARAATALTPSYQRFTLANGLRVVVHTDRKEPIVTIVVRYAVGARDERPERSGFAHLFEHLMFAGSDAVPGDFFANMGATGATGVNGNTTYDGTYFTETVPTGAIDRALFLEADRMAHMDRTIDQAELDRNRGIVRNEMRDVKNQPGGLGAALTLTRLFPAGHPYGNPLLGSMRTLDAATVEDARAFHRRYYTPRNAVLSLAGDIDVATARRLVEQRFGALDGGVPIPEVTAPVPRLSRPIGETIMDQVPQPIVTRHWLTPGSTHRDGPALDMAAKILGTLTGAWLDKGLVRDEPLVTSIMTSGGGFGKVGIFAISCTLAPGADPARASARLDALLDRFRQTGPTRDEIERVAMREIGFQLRTQEATAGQASLLAEGEAVAHDPAGPWRLLATQADLTPVQVRDAARRWLSGPAYTLTIMPGRRPLSVDASSPPAAPAMAAPLRPGTVLPPVLPTPPARFPTVTRFRLSNGITVVTARRPEVPITRIAIAFDGGSAADAPGESGAQGLMMAMLTESGDGRDAAAIARAQERLGANIWFETTVDQNVGTLTTPTLRADEAVALFADLVRRPSFDQAALGRTIRKRQALIAQEGTDPGAVAQRTMAPLLYGADSAYGRASAAGVAGEVAALTPTRLKALSDAWLRPDKAGLFVVSDLPQERIAALLEQGFGGWRAVGEAGRTRTLASTPATPRIVVVDRPGSPQSFLLGAIPTRIRLGDAPDRLFAALAGAGAIGGRIGNDLRERNGWTYGVGSGYSQRKGAVAFGVRTSVQADRTGVAMVHVRDLLTDYVTTQPITAGEWRGAVDGALSGRRSRFERGDAVLDMMRSNDFAGRPDDYTATIGERYRTLSAADVAGATRDALDPGRLIWVVVGDAATITPQLQALRLPCVVQSGSDGGRSACSTSTTPMVPRCSGHLC